MMSPVSSHHRLPEDGVRGPVALSIVVPAANEEVTLGVFVDWCREGLEKGSAPGQIGSPSAAHVGGAGASYEDRDGLKRIGG